MHFWIDKRSGPGQPRISSAAWRHQRTPVSMPTPVHRYDVVRNAEMSTSGRHMDHQPPSSAEGEGNQNPEHSSNRSIGSTLCNCFIAFLWVIASGIVLHYLPMMYVVLLVVPIMVGGVMCCCAAVRSKNNTPRNQPPQGARLVVRGLAPAPANPEPVSVAVQTQSVGASAEEDRVRSGQVTSGQVVSVLDVSGRVTSGQVMSGQFRSGQVMSRWADEPPTYEEALRLARPRSPPL